MKVEQLFNPKAKNIINFVLYFVSYYYVILASINDGFSGILLGIPFALFLIVDVFRKKHFYRYLSVSVLALSCVFYFSDRSTWTLTYPLVGDTFEVTQTINYSSQDKWIALVGRYVNEKYSFEIFEPGTKIRVVKQIFSGNPDFGVAYRYIIESGYSGVTEKYGISDMMLRTIYESENRDYREDRFRNPLIITTHFFYTYPVILVIFFVFVSIRHKASRKNSKTTFIAHREK